MEDTIEVCSKCGKMPRALDQETGYFVCTRCGNNQLMAVKSDDYERIVTELDANYQERVAQARLEVVEKEMPIENPKKKTSRKTTTKKKTKKKPAKSTPAKKKAAKKTTKKKKK